MTINLRPHHLLCILTFVGKGYTKAFTTNFVQIVARLNQGEEIEVVSGPDDICAPVCKLEGSHCETQSVKDRDTAATAELSTLFGRGLVRGSGLILDQATLDRLREAFAAGVIRTGCAGCEWHSLCSDIARAEFPGAHLVVSPRQTT